MQKITTEYLETLIERAEYHRVPNTTTTLCSLILKTGFVVNGQSACIDAAMFDEESGKKYAHEDAFRKLWELEAYRVKSEDVPFVWHLSPDDLDYMHGTLEKEGFDYAFFGYSDFKDIENDHFHILRERYLNARKKLADYLGWDS